MDPTTRSFNNLFDPTMHDPIRLARVLGTHRDQEIQEYAEKQLTERGYTLGQRSFVRKKINRKSASIRAGYTRKTDSEVL